jgi:hypothetical protein
MRAWGPKSVAYPALARARKRNGSGLLVLAVLSAALAVDACGGKVARGGTTSAVTGGTGGTGLAAPASGGTNGDSGGAFALGGASESGGVAAGTGGVWSVTGGTASGGTASGGTATGGSATGGTGPVPVCSTVASLPTLGTACSRTGESQCDASGNQCVCWRGIWNCTTSCATSYPVEPVPGSPCVRGAACNYPSGMSCACLTSSLWLCWGSSACPADKPQTGEACQSFGVACDYPNQNPALHFACVCTAGLLDGSTSTWTCASSAVCPSMQPAYDPTNTCPGLAFCGYGSTRCGCAQAGSTWICGLGLFPFP